MGNIVPIVVGIIVGGIVGTGIRQARQRGRGRWLSPVGRPPRDLFAAQSTNRLVNLVFEWAWIGFVVMLAGVVMFFFSATEDFSELVFWLGIAMIAVRGLVVPLCLAHADLNPEYEDQVTASPA